MNITNLNCLCASVEQRLCCTMDVSTIALLLIAASAVYYYFKKQLNYFKDFGIPNLPGWPIFGNMAKPLFRMRHSIDTIIDLYNVDPNAKYVGFFVFSQPVIVLRDLELIKSITIKHFDNFPDHKSFIDDTVDPLFGANLFNIQGNKWRETRNLLSPTFTSSKMKAMFQLIVECAHNFTGYLGEQPKSFLEQVATKDLFTKYTNDVVATCAFGINVDTLKNPNNDFYVLGREATNLDGRKAVKFFIATVWPQLLKTLRIKFVKASIVNFFKDIVAQTVAMRDEKGIRRPDMIQLMMDARDKEGKHLSTMEMTANAFIFFFGGFETTSTQMCIIAHELAVNPEVQKKLQNEIDEVMKKCQGKPTYEAISAMAYLDAVFNESMRRHPQSPILDRVCRSKSPFELPPTLPGCKPFTVQPGMNVWIPVAGIHMDPKYYDEPEKFDPDRYYEKKVTINDTLNLGFGIGPRSCIGNRFAILETKVMFFFLLAKFNLKATKKTCNPLVYSRKDMALVPVGGYWIGIEARN